MNFLGIDTTAANLYAVLNKNGETFYAEVPTGKTGHSKALMPAVIDLLEKADLEISGVDVIAAVVGPGSFTGIRVGVAAVAALSYAAGAKRVAVSAFELIAYGRGEITAAVDAGHGNLYIAGCAGGRVLKTEFLENDAAGNSAGYETEPSGGKTETLNAVIAKKIEDGEFVAVFEPFYMRKSQAERSKDEE